MTATPRPPVGTVKIEKPMPLGNRIVWVALSQRFTELGATAYLADHPTYRRA